MNPTSDICSMGRMQGTVAGRHGGRYGKTGTKDNPTNIIIKIK